MRTAMLLPLFFCALALYGSGPDVVSAQTLTAAASGDLVVLVIQQPSRTEAIRFISPESGSAWTWPLKQGHYLTGAVAGTPGVVYASFTDDRNTAIYAVDARHLSERVKLTLLATIPGRATAWRLSDGGSALLVASLTGVTGEQGQPEELTALSVHDPSGAPSGAVSKGIAPDVAMPWYEARYNGNAHDVHLWRAMLREGRQPIWTDLQATGSGYYSLLVAPDGHALYFVDYFQQTISAVDPGGAGVKRSIAFGDHPFKRPPCGSALSATGSRLYILSNLTNTQSSGILAYDMESWRQLAHLPNPPATTPYCIGVSPDGKRLFLTSDNLLVTLDATTGREIDRITLTGVATSSPARIVLVTSTTR